MLNEKIKHLRLLNGLNQVQLANALGVSKQCISNWENDNIQPSIEMLIKIAKFFKVSTDYLLGLDSKKLLDVSNLTDLEVTHINSLVSDLEKLHA